MTIAAASASSLMAIGLTRWLSALLFGVSPLDPVTFTVMAGVVFGAGVLAAYVPARREGEIDPATVLKTDG
jgi:putative ABC transport system permease protein